MSARTRRSRASKGKSEQPPLDVSATPAPSQKASSKKVADESPARVARQEERRNLQQLNNRLELYILNRRNCDAEMKSLLVDLQRNGNREQINIATAQQAFEKELVALREERDSLASKLALTESNKNALESEVKVLRDKVKTDREYLKENEGKLTEMAEELQKEKTAKVELQLRCERLGHTVTQHSKAMTKHESDLKRLRQENDVAVGELRTLKAKKQANDADRQRVQVLYDELLKRYAEEQQKTLSGRKKLETKLRAEYAKQLNDILAERQEKYDSEKQEMLQALKEAYEMKLEAHRSKLAEMASEVDLATEKAESEREQSETLRKANEALVFERDGHLKRIANLEQSIKHEREKPSRELEHKSLVIKKLKEAYRRKEIEFDDLLDTKIGLAMEIKAYREMLDREEERVRKITGNIKKRKRNTRGTWVPGGDSSRGGESGNPLGGSGNPLGGSGNPLGGSGGPLGGEGNNNVACGEGSEKVPRVSSASGAASEHVPCRDHCMKSSQEDIERKDAPVEPAKKMVESPLKFSKVDHRYGYLDIRNLSEETVDLKGWRLTNLIRNVLFEFPGDISLNPGEGVFVFKNESDAQNSDEKNALIWPVDNFESGVEAVLLFPGGEVAHTMALINGSQDRNKSCRIM